MLISKQVVFRQLRSLPPCVCSKKFSDIAKDVKDTPKKQMTKSEKTKKRGESGTKNKSENLQKFFDASELSKKFKPNFTDEEKAEHAIIAKEYQRQCTILDNAIHKDLATKTWLQGEALRSMRPDLRKEAEILDDDFPPMDRPWPFWDTPPIKGFNAKDYMKKEDDDEK